jgi:hypothetical protein
MEKDAQSEMTGFFVISTENRAGFALCDFEHILWFY